MSISVTSRGGAVTSRGGWGPTIPFYQDDLCEWNGIEYRSILPYNLGNQPDISSFAWMIYDSTLNNDAILLTQPDVFGRVQVITEPIPSVMDPKWGAKGDGVTADQLAIKNAIIDCSTVGANRGTRCPLRFPEGHAFLCNGTINPRSYVDIQAQGATFLRGSIPNGTPFFRSIAGSGDPTVTDFAIHGGFYPSNGVATAADFMQMNQAQRLEFDHIIFTGLSNEAFHIQDSQHVHIHDNKMFGSLGGVQPIDIVSSLNGNTLPTKFIWIYDNYVENANACIQHVSTASSNRTDPIIGLFIVRNTCIISTGNSPIFIEQGQAAVAISTVFVLHNITVATGANSGYGIQASVDGTGSTDNLNMSNAACIGNIILGAGNSAGSQAGILWGFANSLIADNVIQSANHDIMLTNHGATNPIQNVTVRNNQGGLGSGDHIRFVGGSPPDLTTCVFDTAPTNGPRRQETWVNNAAPATGNWRVGAIAYNIAPAAAGTWAWVCTTAGTPGTWKPIAIGP